MSKKSKARALDAALDALYARLPRLVCKQACGATCGPIPLARGEAERLARVSHRTPRTRDARWCTYLTARGTCDAYAARPLICRVFGLVKRMSCPAGCVPERWMTDREFVAFAAAVERLAGPTLTTTPHGLAPLAEGFVDLAEDIARADAEGRTRAPELMAREEEFTRGLRALFGGRIVGAVPTPEGAATTFIDLDAVRGPK
jgi:uncharacterized protein